MGTVSITKPSFREVGGIINLDDVGLTFNVQRVGPMNFPRLRKARYGKGFRMSIMSELVHLVYASLENQEYKSAKNVIETLRNNYFTGNTGILYTEKGMFVQDNPDLRNGRIFMNHETLEKKLGPYEEKGVVFSEDGSVRFVPYGFKTGKQTPLELSKNLGIIALVDGEENAEKTAKVSGHYKLNPYFWELNNINSRTKRVVGLGSGGFNDRVYVYTDDPDDCDRGYSFGAKSSQ